MTEKAMSFPDISNRCVTVKINGQHIYTDTKALKAGLERMKSGDEDQSE